jgi:hypothetical protein
MKWFRSNIKHGSRLALLALALQFVLSFGHFHAIAAPAALAIQAVTAQSDITSGLIATDAADQSARQPASNNHSDQQPGDVCAICAVIALANSVLFATPPPLLLPQAFDLPYLAADAEFAHLDSAHPAFQSRAPPIS